MADPGQRAGRRGPWEAVGRPPGAAVERLGVAVALAAVAVLLGWPLVQLVTAALAQGWAPVGRALAGGQVARAAGNTLWTAAVVTPLAVAAGTATAVAVERVALPGRRALRLGVLSGLFVPAFVSGQSWASAYGPAGLTDTLLGVAVPGTYGPVGVVVVLAVGAVPVCHLVVAGGLRARVEPDVERAARAAGATGWHAFRSVTLPLLRPSLVAAAALTFVLTVTAFGVPAVLGLPAGFSTLTTRIYRDLAFAADPEAFVRVLVLSVALVALTLAAVGTADLLGGLRGALVRTGAPAGGAGQAGRRRWGVALALWAALALSTGVPLAALVLRALTRAVGLPPTPAHWTTANLAQALDGHAARAVGNSLWLAVSTATLAVVLGALLAALRGRAAGRALGTVAALGFALPGSALAVAVLLAYGGWLRDTLALIGVAYLAKLLALGHRTIAGAVDGVPPDLVRAARASGADGPTAVGTVVLPLLRPALAGAWLLVFLAAVHELTMSSLLYGPGTRTLAVAILNAQQLGDVTVTSALAVLLVAGTAVLAAPLLLLRRRA